MTRGLAVSSNALAEATSCGLADHAELRVGREHVSERLPSRIAVGDDDDRNRVRLNQGTFPREK